MTGDSFVRITEAAVYPICPAEIYGAQPDWLSWSIMKDLVPPKTPAHFLAALEAERVGKWAWDLGKIVLTVARGEGDQFTVVQALNRHKEPYDAEDYTTVSARRHRDEIYAEGKMPILWHELVAATRMSVCIRSHPTASRLLTAPGRPEVAERCHTRVADLKTADDAGTDGSAKAAARLGDYPDYPESIGLSDAITSATAVE